MSKKSWYRIEQNRANPDVATVYLHDEIGLGGVTSKDFIQDLANLTQPNIKLHLNSPGGSVDDGIAIFNALKSRGGTVEVYVDALAASIASVIAMAGDKVAMAPHSRMMIHEAMALGMGFAEDFEKIALRLRDTTRNIASIYTERAGQDEAYWLDKMAAETWFTDQQAVDEGLADEVGRDVVVENAFKIAANFNLSRFRNPPTIEDPAPVTPPEQNAGRTLSQRNLDGLHSALDALGSLHDGTCDMGDDCPMSEAAGAGATNHAGDPAPEGDPAPSPAPVSMVNPWEEAKAELERRLASIQL